MATKRKPLGDADGRQLASARQLNSEAIDLLSRVIAGEGDQHRLIASAMAALAKTSQALAEMQSIRDRLSPRKASGHDAQ